MIGICLWIIGYVTVWHTRPAELAVGSCQQLKCGLVQIFPNVCIQIFVYFHCVMCVIHVNGWNPSRGQFPCPMLRPIQWQCQQL